VEGEAEVTDSPERQEASQRQSEIMREYERLFDIFRGYAKARSSGEMSEREYKEKVSLIIQQQESLKKEFYGIHEFVTYGTHPEHPRSV